MKNKWLLVLLAGLLLLVIAMPVSDKKNQETKEELTKSDTGGKETKNKKRDDRLRRDDGGTDALCQKGACPHCGRSGSSL